MTAAEICQKLKDRLGDAVVQAKPEGIHPFVKVAPAKWREAAAFAKDDLGCESLHDLTAVDSKDKKTLTVLVHLWSFRNRHWVNLKTDVDRNAPSVASLEPLWKGADWHERECYDMFGVRFEGHPNLTRILCPEDWVGWPLRKDYVLPEYYHGIPGIPILRAKEAEKGRVFPPAKKPGAAPAKPAAAAPAAAAPKPAAPAATAAPPAPAAAAPPPPAAPKPPVPPTPPTPPSAPGGATGDKPPAGGAA
jgi:NADH-quinone oxidoreductase subunit C